MVLSNFWTADFETTTQDNDCRVWAFSACNIGDYNQFEYGTSIEEFFEFILRQPHNCKIWFHNLKFDIQFMLSFLFNEGYEWIPDPKEKKDKTFTTLITDLGQFYALKIYFTVRGHHTKKVEIFDSMKIFPNFSVERIAEGFNLPISKLSIDYKKYRPKGYELSQEEIDYIRNDVEITARALKIMFSEGHTKMTIASDAMTHFKDNFVGFRKKFPILPPEVDKDIRKSYRGGFTYVNDKWQGKITGKGITLDVNSLYPSTLVNNLMPYGKAVYFDGKYQNDTLYPLYVQNLSCSFEIKPNHVPSIQLKNNMSFMANEYVKSSHNEIITLTLTNPDLELFFDQYNVYNVKWLGGWKFKGARGYFDNYVNYWTEQKIKAGKEGNAPMRQISKLLLNSLYGRFALSGTAGQKAPYMDDNGIVRYYNLPEETRETVYIPVGCFVTAYGRSKTIRSFQAVTDFTLKKYGEDRCKYADTDSLHADLSDEDLEELKSIIEIDDYKLGFWKKEAEFGRALYIRSKCYIEEIDGKVHVTVAGLPKYMAPLITFDNFKKGFSTAGMTLSDLKKLAIKNGASKEEVEKLHHKLTYKYVKGGVILSDTDFTIK